MPPFADILGAVFLTGLGAALVLAVCGIVRAIVRPASPAVRRAAWGIVLALVAVAVGAAIDMWFYGGSGNFRAVIW